MGYVGYRARNVAAREVKRHTGIDELMPRWHAELAEIGWTVDRFEAALEEARAACTGVAAPLTNAEIDQITAQLLDVDGSFLARSKVFTRTRLIAEVAALRASPGRARRCPRSHHRLAAGHPIDRCGPRRRTALHRRRGAGHRTRHRQLRRTPHAPARPGPQVDPARILAAIAAKQDEIGAELSDGHYTAVNAICTSGRVVDAIVGIAGSGKTTALDAATTALEGAGYRVIGTATSGQAARTLGDAAGIEPARCGRCCGSSTSVASSSTAIRWSSWTRPG